jgi:hypothetical protein
MTLAERILIVEVVGSDFTVQPLAFKLECSKIVVCNSVITFLVLRVLMGYFRALTFDSKSLKITWLKVWF